MRNSDTTGFGPEAMDEQEEARAEAESRRIVKLAGRDTIAISVASDEMRLLIHPTPRTGEPGEDIEKWVVCELMRIGAALIVAAERVTAGS